MKHAPSRLTLMVLAAVLAVAPAIAAVAPLRSPCVPPANTTLIEFRSDGNTLRGFIDIPEGSGRHPAIVMVQGSGRSDVTVDTGLFEEMRQAFRRAGIATLIWDKPGDGCSEGKYSRGFPIRERTTETIAAVQTLQRRDDIDPARIGLWGVSQGGWVAPMAAVRSRDVAFLIVVSGPVRDAISQMTFDAISRLRETGIGAAEANAAHAVLQRAFAIARAGGGPEEFLAAVEPLQKYPLLRELHMLDATSRGYMSAAVSVPEWSISADILLREIDQPTLALFGERDTMVDSREGAEVYRDSFAGGGNKDLTIKTFRNAGHGMVAAPGSQPAQGSIFVDGYIDTMVAWLKTHNFAGAER